MKLIRPTCGTCKALIKAIDAYIAKVDNDLEEEMDNAGYADAKKSIEGAAALEEELTEILTEQSEDIADALQGANTESKAKKALSSFFEDDITGVILNATFQDYFTEAVTDLSSIYLRESEGDMVVEELRHRTTSWIESWSEELSNLMQLTSENNMTKLLQNALDKGEGVDKLARAILDDGIRNEAYRARAASLTEMLRAHSVARQEGIMQSPSTDRKKWVHTGAHKNKPRENHVSMNGQIVPKAEPFELTGRDGATYHPMYPRDPILPAAESINCHCTHVGVANDDILGLSYEERQQMREEYLAQDNGEWEKELDEANRKRSGLDDELEISMENSRKYGEKYTKETQVDSEKCSGTAFKKRIDTVTESEEESKAVFESAKEILDHRNRTHYEDLSFVYPDGSYTTNTQYDYYDKKRKVSACKPSKRMKKELKRYNDYEVISIHNHPGSTVPSFEDLASAHEKKYKYGLVFCHDGKIFKYKIKPDAQFGEFSTNKHLDKLNKSLYNGDTDGRDEALRKLNELGIEMEVLE